METERFHTAKGFVVFIGLLGASGLALAIWMTMLGTGWQMLAIMYVSAAVLVPLAVIEWRVPALEVEAMRIVMRQARMRAAVVIERPPGVVLAVRSHLLGFQLLAVNGEAWVTGRGHEVAIDGGRALVVPARALADKPRLEAALKRWASLAS